MRRFEEDCSAGHTSNALEPPFSVFRPNWREPKEGELVGGEARCRKRGKDGAGAWNRFDTNARRYGVADQASARIRNGRRAGVRDHGNIFSVLKTGYQRCRLP